MSVGLRPLGMRVVMDAPLPPGHDLKKIYSNLPPPPPAQAAENRERPPSKIDVDHWCRQLTYFIVTGRLHCIDKIVAIIAHLEPRAVPIFDIKPDYLHLAPAQPPPGSATSPRLDQTEYLSSGLKPLSVQLVKSASKAKIVVENLFNWRAVSEVFNKVVDPHRLSYANLYDAFDLDDPSLVLRPECPLPLTPQVGSVVLPFLLLVLYVKLASNTPGSDDVSILFSKLKRTPPMMMDIPNMPAEVFLSALAERRVRFFESPALDQFGVVRGLKLQRSTLYWNELFENAELDYLGKSYRATELAQTIRNSVRGPADIEKSQPQTIEERAELTTRNPDRLAQFDECIHRMRQYRFCSPSILLSNLRFLSSQRKWIHPSQFTPDVVDLLLACLEDYSHPSYMYTPVIIPSLQLLVAWLRICNDETATNLLRQDPQRPIAEQTLKGVSILDNLFNRCNPDGALFALCITYLGASVGVLGERSDISVDTIMRYLEKQPDVLVRSSHLATILSGVGDAMVSLSFDRLARVTSLLLRLWTPSPDQVLRQRAVSRRAVKGKDKGDDTASNDGATQAHFLPPLEHGLILFQLLQYVFVTRAMKRAAFAVAPPPPHTGQRGDGGGADWLQALAAECKAAYDDLDRGGHSATHFMALFAAGGLLKGITVFKKHYEVSAQEEQLLDTARSSMLGLISHSLHLSIGSAALPLDEGQRYRRHATAVVCTNIDPLQLMEEDRALLLRLVLDVLLGEVFAYSWIFDAMQIRDPALLPKMVEAKDTVLFRQSRSFTQSLGVLFPSLQPCDRQYALDRLHMFAEELYQGWRSVKRADEGRSKDPTEKEVRTFMQMIFLCINTLFVAVLEVMSGEQCVRALQTISFIQFARVPVTIYDQVVHKIAQQAAVDKDNIKGIIELFPLTSTDGEITTLDDHELARMRFFMVAVLPILPLVPENLLSEKLLPMMFKNVAHKDVRVSKGVHQMFKSLFIDPWEYGKNAMQPHVTKLVPYYVKVCLEHYGYVPFASFTDSFLAIVSALPPTSSLVVLSLKMLADKIQEIQQLVADPNTASQQQSLSLRSTALHEPNDPRQLILLLFNFMVIADIQILDVVLVLIRNIIKGSSPEGSTRPQLLKLAHDIILRNFDYTRKDQCVKWYLRLAHELQLGSRQAARLVPPPPAAAATSKSADGSAPHPSEAARL